MIFLDNAVRSLWAENKAIPVLTEPEEKFLAHSRKDSPRVSTKGNHNKALIFSTYCFALNNVPRGFQSEWLEMKLGMDNSYIQQIVNRNSVKYSDLKAEDWALRRIQF